MRAGNTYRGARKRAAKASGHVWRFLQSMNGSIAGMPRTTLIKFWPASELKK